MTAATAGARPEARTGAGGAALLAALSRRLEAVRPILLPTAPRGGSPGAMLDLLVRRQQQRVDPAEVWLLLVALSTVMPDQDAVRRAVRGLERHRAPGDALRFLLEASGPDAKAVGDVFGDLRIVVGGVLVDVDFTARHDLNTGVQRVVRGLLPRWHRDHEIVPVGWTARQGALCELSAEEGARVLAWSGDPRAGQATPRPARPGLVVPWRSVLVLAEVTSPGPSARTAALAQHSGNAVVAVGYDAIPVASAHLLPPIEPERFTRYLTTLKHVRRVAGISDTAAAEFAGFTAMLPGQGLTGPAIVSAPLPVAMPESGPPAPAPDGADVAAGADGGPLVLCVGTLDTRKNPLATLYAAEVLWREGRRFRLHFVVGGGAPGEGHRRLEELAAAGRPVSYAVGVSDGELQRLYAAARFTVFPSLHEGYGLPVAESLAHGVPVVTTSYGSTAEIAAGGGALLVDPRDDEALVAALRTLLADDTQLEVLRAQIASRPAPSWDDYAAALWTALVDPELDELARAGAAS